MTQFHIFEIGLLVFRRKCFFLRFFNKNSTWVTLYNACSNKKNGHLAVPVFLKKLLRKLKIFSKSNGPVSKYAASVQVFFTGYTEN